MHYFRFESMVTLVGMATIILTVLQVSHPVRARYLPTRGDLSDEAVLKNIIRELIIDPNYDQVHSRIDHVSLPGKGDIYYRLSNFRRPIVEITEPPNSGLSLT